MRRIKNCSARNFQKFLEGYVLFFILSVSYRFAPFTFYTFLDDSLRYNPDIPPGTVAHLMPTPPVCVIFSATVARFSATPSSVFCHGSTM